MRSPAWLASSVMTPARLPDSALACDVSAGDWLFLRTYCLATAFSIVVVISQLTEVALTDGRSTMSLPSTPAPSPLADSVSVITPGPLTVACAISRLRANGGIAAAALSSLQSSSTPPASCAHRLTAIFKGAAAVSTLDSLARIVSSRYCGTAMAARMPMMATTTISSISVKARWVR